MTQTLLMFCPWPPLVFCLYLFIYYLLKNDSTLAYSDITSMQTSVFSSGVSPYTSDLGHLKLNVSLGYLAYNVKTSALLSVPIFNDALFSQT